jgi:acyl carrier protein
MNQLLEIINQVLINKGGKPITSLSDSTHLRNELGFDSFDLAELTVRVEDALGKDIFESGIVNTIGDIRKIIEK